MILIEENSFSKAEYDSQSKIIYFKVTGDVHMPRAKLVLDAQVDFAEDNEVLGILTDITELHNTISTMAGYIATEYFPPLIEKGLVCNAIVVSTEIFHQIAAKELIKRMKDFGIELFYDKNEARKWLLRTVESHTCRTEIS